MNFLDSQTVYAVGANGLIMASSDGGATWSTETSTATDDLMFVHFSGNVGWSVGESGRIIRRSPITNIPEKEDYRISAYPNPASDELRFDLRDDKLLRINFFNSTGELVLVSFEDKINVNLFPEGWYYAEVFSGKGRSVRKVCVVR